MTGKPADSGLAGRGMVLIKGGCFQMGSPFSEKGRASDEKQHRVCVKDFYAGKHKVTKGEFAAFVWATGYKTSAETEGGCFHWYDGEWQRDASKNWRRPGFYQTDQHSVTCVSWYEAIAYARWLCKRTGLNYRLGTEAEWEYAARAGASLRRFTGEKTPIIPPYAITPMSPI